MASKLDIHLPSKDFLFKVVIAVALIMLIVRMTPDKWGIKKYFVPFATS